MLDRMFHKSKGYVSRVHLGSGPYEKGTLDKRSVRHRWNQRIPTLPTSVFLLSSQQNLPRGSLLLQRTATALVIFGRLTWVLRRICVTHSPVWCYRLFINSWRYCLSALDSSTQKQGFISTTSEERQYKEKNLWLLKCKMFSSWQSTAELIAKNIKYGSEPKGTPSYTELQRLPLFKNLLRNYCNLIFFSKLRSWG